MVNSSNNKYDCDSLTPPVYPYAACIQYVTVPEKRDLNEANFILIFKIVCHTETNVNFKLYRTITLDWTGLCSYFKIHSVELIEKKKKMDIPQFS